MEEALGMDSAQARQQAVGETTHVVGLQAAVRLTQELRHAAAVLELHDGVGRAVGFEVTQHRHDMDMAEARQRPRLVEEALAAPGEVVGKARSPRHDLAVGAAHGELDRQVFLDGDELRELRVERSISNSKAAMADHRIQAIIT